MCPYTRKHDRFLQLSVYQAVDEHQRNKFPLGNYWQIRQNEPHQKLPDEEMKFDRDEGLERLR